MTSAASASVARCVTSQRSAGRRGSPGRGASGVAGGGGGDAEEATGKRRAKRRRRRRDFGTERGGRKARGRGRAHSRAVFVSGGRFRADRRARHGLVHSSALIAPAEALFAFGDGGRPLGRKPPPGGATRGRELSASRGRRRGRTRGAAIAARFGRRLRLRRFGVASPLVRGFAHLPRELDLPVEPLRREVGLALTAVSFVVRGPRPRVLFEGVFDGSRRRGRGRAPEGVVREEEPSAHAALHPGLVARQEDFHGGRGEARLLLGRRHRGGGAGRGRGALGDAARRRVGVGAARRLERARGGFGARGRGERRRRSCAVALGHDDDLVRLLAALVVLAPLAPASLRGARRGDAGDGHAGGAASGLRRAPAPTRARRGLTHARRGVRRVDASWLFFKNLVRIDDVDAAGPRFSRAAAN